MITNVKKYLQLYLRERPLFLAPIRAKEAALFQKYLPFKKPVLDFGCGDGFFAKVILPQKTDSPIDVGLDITDSRIRESGKYHVYKKTVIYNGNKIPYPDNYFSTIISNCVLEHIKDLDGAVAEIYRVLKPGGRLITTVANKNWENYLLGNLVFGDLYKQWMRKKQVHYHLLTVKEWEETFKKAHFKIKEETGYLNRKAVRVIDLCHYLSFPSLITYKLLKRWVIWRNKIFLFPAGLLTALVSPTIFPAKSANLFFMLQKK